MHVQSDNNKERGERDLYRSSCYQASITYVYVVTYFFVSFPSFSCSFFFFSFVLVVIVTPIPSLAASMFRASVVCLRTGRRWWREGLPNYTRAQQRRSALEQKRIEHHQRYPLPPIEPTAAQAVQLYRALLRKGHAQLVVTDVDYFRRKVRWEFEVTARQTSGRVRGIMFEKGWAMARGNLGGII
ncbi:hypothetical protein STCU_06777 [Strigomonas culicis]|uniref:Uncharacterized protein n=1 Tax=Strigomonas culicis TaxID=28005 RepID=S9VDX0_9TRYP|nr:hypothetical protein STCU_06777 [Strigomonas culicis]|eukprot:EPY25231.1 hypothetical protein STCU_06777 [Strigomonas culicis]